MRQDGVLTGLRSGQPLLRDAAAGRAAASGAVAAARAAAARCRSSRCAAAPPMPNATCWIAASPSRSIPTPTAIDRILPFDLIPRVITAAEWRSWKPACIQRVRALNLFLHDIYHDQKILTDGVVPRDLVLGNADYCAGDGRLRSAARHLCPCLRHRHRPRRRRPLPGAGGQCPHAVGRLLRGREPPHDAARAVRPDGRPAGAPRRRLRPAAAPRDDARSRRRA